MTTIDGERIRLALEKADITIAELAIMTKISRQTIYKWLKPNAVVKSASMLQIVMVAVKKIEDATKIKRLPLSDTIPRSTRITALWEAIKKVD